MSLEHADLCRLIDGEAAEILRLLAVGDRGEVLATAVRSCPGWTARDLVGHLGAVHRWATEVVRTRSRASMPDPPYDDADLAPWFADGAHALTETLRATEPDDGCWSFALPHTVGFWSRRQLHETMVHRWDLADALDRPAPLEAELAADGVDETVTALFPRQVRLGRQPPLTDTVALADAATGQRWVLAGDGAGAAEEAPDATVTAAAGDLLLLVWRRRTVDDVAATVTGDGAAARRVLAAQLTP